MSGSYFDPNDPMFQPLTYQQAIEITGRTRRTIERWVTEGRLTKHERQYRRQVRIVFNEAEIVEIEKERNDAAIENRDRIRRRAGQQGTAAGREDPGLDADSPGVA